MALSYDKHLLRRLKRGDKESFNELFECCYARCLTFAKKLLRDASAAEDVVQNVFIRLWIGRELLDEDRSIDNYLLVSIRHEIFNHLRLCYNAKRYDIELPDVADDQVDAEQYCVLREIETRIQQIIEMMPSQRRLVFEVSRHGHLTNAEIAQRLNLSQRTVEKHIEQALKQLRATINVSAVVLILQLF